MDGNNKDRFDEFVSDIREDVSTLSRMFQHLLSLLEKDATASGTKAFAYDSFLDKCFEINSKITQFCRDFSISMDSSYESSLNYLKTAVEEFTHGVGIGPPTGPIQVLDNRFQDYVRWLDKALNDLRRALYNKGKSLNKSIDPTLYLIQTRKKFITARDELGKAETLIQQKDMSDVITHARSAIELAIKERFGFRKITNMSRFLKDAEEFGLTLPSYDLIYAIYDFGSKRLHSGRILEPFEARQILRIVSQYIEELEMLQVPQEKIEEFRAKSKSIE